MATVPPWSASASTAAYSPFAPSPLSGPALSSTAGDSPVRRSAAQEDAHLSSDPAMPSSPTPPSRPTARSASYKSRTSSRRVVSSSPASPSFQALSPSSSSSSSPVRGTNPLANETRRLAQENSRLSRARILKLHHLASRSRSSSAAGGTSTIPDGPGGWVDGEWEEFDEEEMARLEIEARKARREYEYRMRSMAELASEEGAWIGPDEVEEGMIREEEPEPPLDVLFDENDLEAFDLAHEGNDSLMLDHDDNERLPPDPDPQPRPVAAAASSSSPSITVFDSSLLSTPFCPACGATDRPLAGDAERGLYCAGGGARSSGGCGWGIEMNVLLSLREAFLGHGSPLMGHAPLLSYTPFTGTVVLCSEPNCDEQYGA